MNRIFDEERAAARHECAVEMAERMLADNLPHEKIARYVQLSLDEIEELASKAAVSS